jgi:hypothetical protein
MFLENSRYHKQPTVEVETREGKSVQALKLRKLPTPANRPHAVQQHDRLDVLAQQHYADGSKFWHIADANSELEANDLVAEPGTVINVPET